MISKNDIKRIQQLQLKKFRSRENAFIAETPKVVEEFLQSGFKRVFWFATERYVKPTGIQENPSLISEREMKSISRLDSPSDVLAVFEMPEEINLSSEGITLALDGVRDPGNMGTIIRLADWFGIKQVAISEDCVDIWNPKVVQSTMGSLARILPQKVSLPSFISDAQSNGVRVFCADMNGTSHYETQWPNDMILVMGNEGVGPSKPIVELSDQIVTIPRAPEAGAESLNVAMATGILLAELRRP